MTPAYDVVIFRRGVAFGPAGTEPFSKGWSTFEDTALFFDRICRPDFDLNVRSWRVKASW